MNKIRKFMFDRNITLNELSELIGCSIVTLSRILRGCSPSDRYKYKINKIIGENVFPLQRYEDDACKHQCKK